MRLLFVASSDGYNGENGDLFVIAETRDEAIDLWRAHYELDPLDRPDHVFEVPAALQHFEPKGRALKWHKEVLEI
jgi:hypothetical protein